MAKHRKKRRIFFNSFYIDPARRNICTLYDKRRRQRLVEIDSDGYIIKYDVEGIGMSSVYEGHYGSDSIDNSPVLCSKSYVHTKPMRIELEINSQAVRDLKSIYNKYVNSYMKNKHMRLNVYSSPPIAIEYVACCYREIALLEVLLAHEAIILQYNIMYDYFKGGLKYLINDRKCDISIFEKLC